MQRAVEAIRVTKRYRLGEQAAAYGTIRDVLGNLVRREPSAAPQEIAALDGVSLSVNAGEVLGIIGRNGAGKTTLLRLVSRITRPTAGVVRVRGRVGTLLEVGTGFHPELTGRENVLLNGALLGMRRQQVLDRFDAIAEFAGLDPAFLDTPLKRFSSGMRLRLAFSIAAHLESDVVVVDEVLAVGDAEFQRRCVGAMSDLAERGRTVLFVSHDLGTVARLCTRAIWLDQGSIQADGAAEDVVRTYGEQVSTTPLSVWTSTDEDGPAVIRSAAVLGATGEEVPALRRGVPLRIALRLDIRRPAASLRPAIAIQDIRGTTIINEGWDLHGDGVPFPKPGEYDLEFTVPPLLATGDYTARLWLGTSYEDYLHTDLVRFHLPPEPEEENLQDRPRAVEVPDAGWSIRPA